MATAGLQAERSGGDTEGCRALRVSRISGESKLWILSGSMCSIDLDKAPSSTSAQIWWTNSSLASESTLSCAEGMDGYEVHL